MSGSDRPHRIWSDRPAPRLALPVDVALLDGPADADGVIVGANEWNVPVVSAGSP